MRRMLYRLKLLPFFFYLLVLIWFSKQGKFIFLIWRRQLKIGRAVKSGFLGFQLRSTRVQVLSSSSSLTASLNVDSLRGISNVKKIFFVYADCQFEPKCLQGIVHLHFKVIPSHPRPESSRDPSPHLSRKKWRSVELKWTWDAFGFGRGIIRMKEFFLV